MINFNVVRQNGHSASTAILEKDALTTDIVQGQFCTIDATTGLVIKAVAASTQIALVMQVIDDTHVMVLADPTAVIEGTADAAFDKTMRNTEVDIAIDGAGNQTIDVGASATDVLKVLATEDAGTVGSVEKVKVIVNKPLSL